MPVNAVRRKGRLVGYRWGSKGKLYRLSKYGNSARLNALNQGRAIILSQARTNRLKRIFKRRKDGVVQRYKVRRK